MRYIGLFAHTERRVVESSTGAKRDCHWRSTSSTSGDELAGPPSQVRVGAGGEGGRGAAADVVVVGELGEVLVGEVGGAVQLLRHDQAEDLGLLTLTAGVDHG